MTKNFILKFRKTYFKRNQPAIITGRNEVVAKVIFLHLFVILFTGGACLRQTPLGANTPLEADTP